ncbi:MAG: hypothetical protein SFY81_13260 [Verrucomicrobiota bacterium]|nr:hypothetical protein [Verrucomicrobiota bacterium]
MRLHFVICAWCRRYFKQVNFLHEHAARVEMLPEGMPERVLSFEAKSRMKAEVRKNLATVM